MTLAEIKLFNDIVDCADKQALAGASSPCCAIINAQSSLPVRQVPEPWNGNLSEASFLVLGSNPALDVDEVFPQKYPLQILGLIRGQVKTQKIFLKAALE